MNQIYEKQKKQIFTIFKNVNEMLQDREYIVDILDYNEFLNIYYNESISTSPIYSHLTFIAYKKESNRKIGVYFIDDQSIGK